MSELKESTVLKQAAYIRALEMREKGYFAHQEPDSIEDRFIAVLSNFDYSHIGDR